MNDLVDLENKSCETLQNLPKEIISENQFKSPPLEKSKVNEKDTTQGHQNNSDITSTTERQVSEDDEDTHNVAQLSETFYKDAQTYWKAIPPTIDGMLGGFANINFTDIRGSQDFVKDVFKMKPAPNKNVALDCGAGKNFWEFVEHIPFD